MQNVVEASRPALNAAKAVTSRILASTSVRTSISPIARLRIGAYQR
jgi:hypothetical protein